MLLPPTLDGQRRPEDSFGDWFTLVFVDGTCLPALFINHGSLGEGQILVFEVSLPANNHQRLFHSRCLVEATVNWMDGEFEGVFQFDALRDDETADTTRRFRLHETCVRRIIQGVIPHG